MKEATSHQAEAGRAGAALWCLILAPAVLHIAAILGPVLRGSSVAFEKLDLAVLLLVFAYLVTSIIVTRRRAWAMGFALLTYSSLTGLGVGEIVLRAMQEPSVQLPLRPRVRRVYHPKGNMPGLADTSVYSSNSLGLRGPETPLETARVRILAVGGSTTQSIEVTDELSWPWLLEDNLTKELGFQVYVGNAGVSGHFTLHHDYLLRNYTWSKEFEWVVLLLGINDAGNLLQDRYEARRAAIPLETLVSVGGADVKSGSLYYRRLRAVQLATEAVRRVRAARMSDSDRTIVVESDLSHFVRQRRLRAERLQTHGMLTELPKGLPLALTRYRQDVLAIVQTCRRQGQKCVFLTQPTMYRAQMPPELAALIWHHVPNGAYSPGVLAEVMDAYNETLLAVCREQSLDCIDLASMMPKDTTSFFDDCHFNIPGSARVAKVLTDFFLQKLASHEAREDVERPQVADVMSGSK
jgi:lysophospholipase L1-like esterase